MSELLAKYLPSKFLFGAAVLVAFFPALFLFWLFLLGSGIFLIRFFIVTLLNSAGFRSRCSIVVGALIFLPAAFIFFIFFYFFVIGLYPTLINFWAAYLLSGLAKLRWLRFLCFIIALPLLGLSYRLLPMTEDILHGEGRQKIEIIKRVKLGRDEALTINLATETVSWLRDPGDFIVVGANEGTMTAYWTLPENALENVRGALQNAGIHYTMNAVGGKRLEVQQQNDNGLLRLKLVAWDGDQQTASYEGLFRKAYGPEQALYGRRASIDAPAYRLLYLLSANLWNKLLGLFLPKPPVSPIKTFIEQAFKIERPLAIAANEAKPVLAKMIGTLARQDNLRIFGVKEDLQCKGKLDVDNHQIKFLAQGEEFTVFLQGDTRLVKCTDSTIYVVTHQRRRGTPLAAKPIDLVELSIYSRRGELVDRRLIEFAQHSQDLSYSRLENFIETENSYQFEMNDFDPASNYSHEGGAIWSLPKSVSLIQP